MFTMVTTVCGIQYYSASGKHSTFPFHPSPSSAAGPSIGPCTEIIKGCKERTKAHLHFISSSLCPQGDTGPPLSLSLKMVSCICAQVMADLIKVAGG